jgi:nitric oxide dioxygenase
MALSYQQSKLVKDTIPALREHGEKITTIFYRNMLRDHPELNSLFNSVNLKTGRQPRALTSVILSFASNITNISELIPKFERMCNKHCSLGIQPEHYEIVGKYLLRAFGEVLGPAMTPAVFAAWEKAYWSVKSEFLAVSPDSSSAPRAAPAVPIKEGLTRIVKTGCWPRC